jgi:hypothetical protein
MDKPKKSSCTKQFKVGIMALSRPFDERELLWR